MSHRIETVESGFGSCFTSLCFGVVPLDVRMRANNSAVDNLVAGDVKWSMMEEKVGFGRKNGWKTVDLPDVDKTKSILETMLGRTDSTTALGGVQFCHYLRSFYGCLTCLSPRDIILK